MSQKYADAVDNSKDQATGVDLGTILYSKFGDGHVSPWLVIPAACLSMISIVGFTLNGSVVYVTITSK